MTHFTDLGLAKPLLKALAEEGYDTPTPIQSRHSASFMAGSDLLGIAQTGTGKTAAFALPILQRLAADPGPPPARLRALVLARRASSPPRSPTASAPMAAPACRSPSFSAAFKWGRRFGRSPRRRRLVATPGRCSTTSTRVVNLGAVEVFVLDEADQMLDLGFIVADPQDRRDAAEEAPDPVLLRDHAERDRDLANDMLDNPAPSRSTPVATTAERVDQHVFFVDSDPKRELLAELFADAGCAARLVFTRTKRGADRVAKHLERAGVSADAIHGNKSQGQRERALAASRPAHPRPGRDRHRRARHRRRRRHPCRQLRLPERARGLCAPDRPHGAGRRLGSAISLCDNGERPCCATSRRPTRQEIPTVTDRRSAHARDDEATHVRRAPPQRAGAPNSRTDAAKSRPGAPKSHAGLRPGGPRPARSGSGQRRFQDGGRAPRAGGSRQG